MTRSLIGTRIREPPGERQPYAQVVAICDAAREPADELVGEGDQTHHEGPDHHGRRILRDHLAQPLVERVD